ncbi:hypothetical protein [Erythrobacter sp. MTPC3]|uniref:hypothetical protein n=1 Tax=Erythrobacter sp. MTPC3 TaxID=3056564 RepID=UPI0036F321AC
MTPFTQFFFSLLVSLGLMGTAEGDGPSTPEGAAQVSGQASGQVSAQGASLFAYEDLRQSGRITLSPAFSHDGNTIYFAQADCERIWNCPQLLMRSSRTKTGWSQPQAVKLPQKARVDWPSVSPDGSTLYFSWAAQRDRHAGEDVYEDFDLFKLDLTDPLTVPEAIDEPDINRIRGGSIRKTRFVNNETAPVVTRDRDLYFWTERLDGAGLRDIYVARSDGAGGFLRPEILPAPINNDGENDGAWVAPGGRLMLLTTSERGSTAPANLHVSTFENGSWTTPRMLGHTVNSDYSEFAGRITPDGKTLVFTSDRPAYDGEAGLLHVWQVPVAEVPVLAAAMTAWP